MICADVNSPLDSIDFAEGCVIPIDKDASWTSFDVVNKLRYTLGVRKVGHAGTLDPLATGLVLVCSGKYTKRLNELMGMEKEYVGKIELGKTTPSFDLETEITISGNPEIVTDDQILNASKQFVGEIDQVPPVYSAIRINGERAYKKARKNQEAKMEARRVTIQEFEITKINNPEVEFKLVCSKGTYVRSIAHDLGQKLEVGAHLAVLRRTRIGDFKVKSAWKIDDFVEAYRNLHS